MNAVNKIEKFIDVNEYQKTFEVNLNEDHSAKQFWSKQILILVDKLADQCHQASMNNSFQHFEVDQIQTRIEDFQKDATRNVQLLLDNEQQFLSVRILLECLEVSLRRQNFDDVWKVEKEIENSKALESLKNRLNVLDQIEDFRERWHEIFRGILAGNIFDSGALEIQMMLKSSNNFNLNEALSKIQKRPWLIDNFDAFLERLNKTPKLKTSAIFVDNSGVDIVLGILPFVRELLNSNIKVILCANSQPSLNDVTYNELIEVVNKATEICPTIMNALKEQKLILAESGSGYCCLNFMTLDEKLLDIMIEHEVDLIVIEGMGRTLHTNLNSSFKCDSTLKLAVIKNNYLASRLGGTIFDAICKFEHK